MSATRADQLREAKHPIYNDRKLHLGTFSSNLSGGCSISKIDGALEATWEDTSTLALMGDQMEFEALVPVGRWRGFGGPTNFNGSGFECFTWAAGIGASTTNAGVFVTSHVPTIHPVMAAKQAATVDHITGGRVAFNIVTGWHTAEIEMFGAKQLAHDLRYECAQEWFDIVRRLWISEEEFSYRGQFYSVKDALISPLPLQSPYPVTMNAGSSAKGRHFGARNCDVVFVASDIRDRTPEGMRAKADAFRALAREEYGREIKVWNNAYIVQGDTPEDAKAYLRYYVEEMGDWEAATNLVSGLGVNSESYDKATLDDMKRHFIAGWGGYEIVGTAEQIVDRLSELVDAGLDGTVLSFPRYIEDMRRFQREVYPLLEQAGLR
jgi:alkanesulfonate monooxygenase SsuD/methylene tetrahydromethanopterin reductase-like flavin-dependent oxidoreductase (luciferase family)